MIIDSPRQLAHDLNRHLRLGLTARPWNLYDPAETPWWLVPSTDWPAYRYGKLMFSTARHFPRRQLCGLNDDLLAVDAIFAGLNIEKGYGSVASEVDPSLKRKTDQIMDNGWAWWSVVDGKDGTARFARMLSELSVSIEAHLYVVSSYVHDRESDVQAEWDAVMFSCDAGGLRAVLHNSFPLEVLSGIERTTDFAGVVTKLRTVDDYHWVDMYVGAHLARREVDATELYQRLISHLDAWVVETPRA